VEGRVELAEKGQLEVKGDLGAVVSWSRLLQHLEEVLKMWKTQKSGGRGRQ
jgi:hypothetical protein